MPLPAPPVWQAFLQPLPAAAASPSLYVDVLRLDRVDPGLSGNKWLKLQGWWQQFQTGAYQALLSFGGAHSNHLHALAHLAARAQVPARLLVRGYASAPLTPTLQDCLALGAQLEFLDRSQWARRYDLSWQQMLAAQHQALVIPEGGAGEPGLQGCRALADTAAGYDQVWLAVGSGTTALGLAQGLAALDSRTLLVGVNAVADQGERRRQWQQQMPATVSWQLIDDAHGGGFARCSVQLLALIQRYDALGLPLEPVYTAKLVQALEQRSALLAEQRLLLVHSGGLQGRRGYPGLGRATSA
ncbi:pyridoxal-phosphate dependent enzyme [Oceanospirillaceae bacterium ASx5O]|nr:pyridoxal-phosphate dependent enzyme [Oceanospirillaceae bacterium ASx5O]